MSRSIQVPQVGDGELLAVYDVAFFDAQRQGAAWHDCRTAGIRAVFDAAVATTRAAYDLADTDAGRAALAAHEGSAPR